MEEFVLGGLLARDERDVVHQQQVGHAVLHPEVLGAAGADGRDQLVGELLKMCIRDSFKAEHDAPLLSLTRIHFCRLTIQKKV